MQSLPLFSMVSWELWTIWRAKGASHLMSSNVSCTNQVGFASMSGGKGSIADWKRRIMETCSKVKTNKAVATPVPSYWCEGSAFEPWHAPYLLRCHRFGGSQHHDNLRKSWESNEKQRIWVDKNTNFYFMSNVLLPWLLHLLTILPWMFCGECGSESSRG